MTEASTPQPSRPQPPEELHWGISYLREDIQDLKQDTREGFQELRQELRQEIRTVHHRIDETNRRLDETAKNLGTRIDEKYELLNKRLDSRFSSLVTAMIAIGGLIVSLLGVVIVMIKG